MWKGRRTLAPVAAGALVVVLGACGDSVTRDNCDPPKVGTKPNCSCPSGTEEPNCSAAATCTQTKAYDDSGKVPANTLAYDDFSVPDSGRLDVTLDWTFPSSDVGFYLVPANTCTVDEFNTRSCNFLVRSEPSTAKPRKVSTPNFAAGNYRWLIANYADKDESVSFQIVVAKGSGCPPLAGGAPSAASAQEPERPAIRRMQHR
jgi:hypothetical protein